MGSWFTFEISIVLSLITLYFYIKIFSIETTIRNALKEGKPDRNHTAPLVSENQYKTINQRRKHKIVHIL
jgi:hypothetical protein